jgi:hypothetical protein
MYDWVLMPSKGRKGKTLEVRKKGRKYTYGVPGIGVKKKKQVRMPEYCTIS